MRTCTYLALGDSYTIGEHVLLAESFPYQTIQLLRQSNKDFFFNAPEIIAKTGWTTDELSLGISRTTLLPDYDFVSLLIGVNNQYRGRPVENYGTEFKALLQTAIQFAGNEPTHVFVLSIPDWGITPFAAERDIVTIAAQIDEYNSTCKLISENFHCNFLDITNSLRRDARLQGFIAPDGLHPSGREYAKWAITLGEKVSLNL